MEAEGAQAQRWEHQLGLGRLGEQLVDEGKKRLRRFRGYVRRPGPWENPSWKQDELRKKVPEMWRFLLERHPKKRREMGWNRTMLGRPTPNKNYIKKLMFQPMTLLPKVLSILVSGKKFWTFAGCEDVDVQLAQSFHVGLKQCAISGNFSIGDIMDGERQQLMAASPSLWEQAMLLVHMLLQELEQKLGRKVTGLQFNHIFFTTCSISFIILSQYSFNF